jgi:hypothetical protein
MEILFGVYFLLYIMKLSTGNGFLSTLHPVEFREQLPNKFW